MVDKLAYVSADHVAMAAILLVEETYNGLSVVRSALEVGSYHVLHTTEWKMDLWLQTREQPALVIVNGMTLKREEVEVLHCLRQTAPISVLLTTARSEAWDRVMALELGVDDTLPRTFSLREFVAWVGALLRRTELVKQRQLMNPAKASPLLTYQTLCLDHRTHQVALGGEVLALSPTEFALLHLLMRSPGRVFHRTYLLDTLWGEAYAGGDRTVDNIVLRLRKKLGSQGEAIETVWGIGYRLRESGQKENNTGEKVSSS